MAEKKEKWSSMRRIRNATLEGEVAVLNKVGGDSLFEKVTFEERPMKGKEMSLRSFGGA